MVDAGKSVRSKRFADIKFFHRHAVEHDIPPSLSALIPKRQPVQELGKDRSRTSLRTRLGQFESAHRRQFHRGRRAIATHLTGGAMPSLDDNAIFAADKLSQFPQRAAVLRLAQREDIFHRARAHPACGSRIRRAQPRAAGSVGQNPRRVGAIGIEERGNHLPPVARRLAGDFFLSAPESSRAGIFKISPPREKAPARAVRPADAVEILALASRRPEILADLQAISRTSPPAR